MALDNRLSSAKPLPTSLAEQKPVNPLALGVALPERGMSIQSGPSTDSRLKVVLAYADRHGLLTNGDRKELSRVACKTAENLVIERQFSALGEKVQDFIRVQGKVPQTVLNAIQEAPTKELRDDLSRSALAHSLRKLWNFQENFSALASSKPLPHHATSASKLALPEIGASGGRHSKLG